MKIKELSLEELAAYIDAKVEEKMLELIGDPDEGLELRQEFVARLKKSLESKEPTIAAEEVARRLGLKW